MRPLQVICNYEVMLLSEKQKKNSKSGVKIRKWSKTSFWSKMSMKFKSGMLKIPPWFGFYVGNPRGGPLPLHAVFSCTFEARYYASGILLGFCVRKKALLPA